MARTRTKIYGWFWTTVFMLPYMYFVTQLEFRDELKASILINMSLCLFSAALTFRLIPLASRYMYRRKMLVIDIKKQGTIRVPEPLGIVVGIGFLFVVIVFLGVTPFLRFNVIVDSTWLLQYYSALTSICFMILIGFVAEVLNVPWRLKMVLPLVAVFPMLVAYDGDTTIVIPKPFIPYVGLEMLNLGWMYKLYMCLLALFCTNSINLHAGINGLKVGQTIVIATAISLCTFEFSTLCVVYGLIIRVLNRF